MEKLKLEKEKLEEGLEEAKSKNIREEIQLEQWDDKNRELKEKVIADKRECDDLAAEHEEIKAERQTLKDALVSNLSLRKV